VQITRSRSLSTQRPKKVAFSGNTPEASKNYPEEEIEKQKQSKIVPTALAIFEEYGMPVYGEDGEHKRLYNPPNRAYRSVVDADETTRGKMAALLTAFIPELQESINFGLGPEERKVIQREARLDKDFDPAKDTKLFNKIRDEYFASSFEDYKTANPNSVIREDQFKDVQKTSPHADLKVKEESPPPALERSEQSALHSPEASKSSQEAEVENNRGLARQVRNEAEENKIKLYEGGRGYDTPRSFLFASSRAANFDDFYKIDEIIPELLPKPNFGLDDETAKKISLQVSFDKKFDPREKTKKHETIWSQYLDKSYGDYTKDYPKSLLTENQFKALQSIGWQTAIKPQEESLLQREEMPSTSSSVKQITKKMPASPEIQDEVMTPSSPLKLSPSKSPVRSSLEETRPSPESPSGKELSPTPVKPSARKTIPSPAPVSSRIENDPTPVRPSARKAPMGAGKTAPPREISYSPERQSEEESSATLVKPSARKAPMSAGKTVPSSLEMSEQDLKKELDTAWSQLEKKNIAPSQHDVQQYGRAGALYRSYFEATGKNRKTMNALLKKLDSVNFGLNDQQREQIRNKSLSDSKNNLPKILHSSTISTAKKNSTSANRPAPKSPETIKLQALKLIQDYRIKTNKDLMPHERVLIAKANGELPVGTDNTFKQLAIDFELTEAESRRIRNLAKERNDNPVEAAKESRNHPFQPTTDAAKTKPVAAKPVPKAQVGPRTLEAERIIRKFRLNKAPHTDSKTCVYYALLDKRISDEEIQEYPYFKDVFKTMPPERYKEIKDGWKKARGLQPTPGKKAIPPIASSSSMANLEGAGKKISRSAPSSALPENDRSTTQLSKTANLNQKKRPVATSSFKNDPNLAGMQFTEPGSLKKAPEALEHDSDIDMLREESTYDDPLQSMAPPTKTSPEQQKVQDTPPNFHLPSEAQDALYFVGGGESAFSDRMDFGTPSVSSQLRKFKLGSNKTSEAPSSLVRKRKAAASSFKNSVSDLLGTVITSGQLNPQEDRFKIKLIQRLSDKLEDPERSNPNTDDEKDIAGIEKIDPHEKAIILRDLKKLKSSKKIKPTEGVPLSQPPLDAVSTAKEITSSQDVVPAQASLVATSPFKKDLLSQNLTTVKTPSLDALPFTEDIAPKTDSTSKTPRQAYPGLASFKIRKKNKRDSPPPPTKPDSRQTNLDSVRSKPSIAQDSKAPPSSGSKSMREKTSMEELMHSGADALILSPRRGSRQTSILPATPNAGTGSIVIKNEPESPKSNRSRSESPSVGFDREFKAWMRIKWEHKNDLAQAEEEGRKVGYVREKKYPDDEFQKFKPIYDAQTKAHDGLHKASNKLNEIQEAEMKYKEEKFNQIIKDASSELAKIKIEGGNSWEKISEINCRIEAAMGELKQIARKKSNYEEGKHGRTGQNTVPGYFERNRTPEHYGGRRREGLSYRSSPPRRERRDSIIERDLTFEQRRRDSRSPLRGRQRSLSPHDMLNKPKDQLQAKLENWESYPTNFAQLGRRDLDYEFHFWDPRRRTANKASKEAEDSATAIMYKKMEDFAYDRTRLIRNAQRVLDEPYRGRQRSLSPHEMLNKGKEQLKVKLENWKSYPTNFAEFSRKELKNENHFWDPRRRVAKEAGAATQDPELVSIYREMGELAHSRTGMIRKEQALDHESSFAATSSSRDRGRRGRERSLSPQDISKLREEELDAIFDRWKSELTDFSKLNSSELSRMEDLWKEREVKAHEGRRNADSELPEADIFKEMRTLASSRKNQIREEKSKFRVSSRSPVRQSRSGASERGREHGNYGPSDKVNERGSGQQRERSSMRDRWRSRSPYRDNHGQEEDRGTGLERSRDRGKYRSRSPLNRIVGRVRSNRSRSRSPLERDSHRGKGSERRNSRSPLRSIRRLP